MRQVFIEPWRRVWKDRYTTLSIERDPDGGAFVAVDEPGTSGFAVTLGAHAAAEIAAFITTPAGVPDNEWRSGGSRLLIIHEPHGRVRFVVHDIEIFGAATIFDNEISREIAAFISGQE
ncbi:hypothetical protein [Nocardia sp. NBC_01327]|uniref:hypothetical protein n=1 Tax=Nocardia sp. NBC_01327 TaxID=2903593 RepID=UPI002E1075EE|nr:hypothetical protein OG326_24045 [Nocardia sp. NBC_01327]